MKSSVKSRLFNSQHVYSYDFVKIIQLHVYLICPKGGENRETCEQLALNNLKFEIS